MSKSDDKADLWMPIFIGDYIADTQRLSTEQHGAYLLLMMDYWRNGPPPDDDEILQNITRLSKFLWKKHGPVLRKFFQKDGDVLRHKRIDEEISKALINQVTASERGRVAAEARWGKKDASGNAQAFPEQCPSPSPSPKDLKPSPSGQVISTSPRDGSDDLTPDSPAEWIRFLRGKHGVEIDPSSVIDRRKVFPILLAWVKANVTTRQFDDGLLKARAEAKEPIVNVVLYVDRVMSSQAPPRASPRRNDRDESRAAAAASIGLGAGDYDDGQQEFIDAQCRFVEGSDGLAL